MNDHEILLTGRGAHTFRFPPSVRGESCLDIPRKLHFVWLGPKPMPEKYKDNVRGFSAHNPRWAVHLWGDDVLPGVVRTMTNRDLFEQETNVAAKVDLLRYELIHQEGGVYLDVDTLSLGPGSLDKMTGAFLTVSGPPYYNTGNAQFGFAAGSEFLAYVIEHARDPRLRYFRGDGSIPDRTGPTFLTTCVLSFGDLRIVHPNGRELLELVRHTADKNW